MKFKIVKFIEIELVVWFVIFCSLLTNLECCSSSGKSSEDDTKKTTKGKRLPGNNW